jgi:hypothetical protein
MVLGWCWSLTSSRRYSLFPRKSKRQLFVHVLHAVCTSAVPGEPPPVIVVVALRADFYGRRLAYPELATALQDRQMVLGPMNDGELREAVIGPAKAVGLRFEDGLVDLLLRDLVSRDSRPVWRSSGM